jgi:thioredoxin 1
MTRANDTRVGAIRDLDETNFAAMVLAAKGPVAVEFMSYSCSHCAELEPIIEQAAQAVGSDEAVFRVNVVTEEELAGSYGIQGTPTFVMFLNGREIGRAEGPHPTLKNVLATITQPFSD